MIRTLIVHIVRFFLLVLVQVLFLNNFSLYNLAVPWLYVLFILLLPLQTSNFLLFLLSFLMGLSIDLFLNSAGLHAAACTFMAYCRIVLLRLIMPRDGYENVSEPGVRIMGIRWFLIYSFVLVTVHHLVLFNLEIFRISELHIASAKAVFSTVLSMFLIILTQYLFSTKKTRQ